MLKQNNYYSQFLATSAEENAQNDEESDHKEKDQEPNWTINAAIPKFLVR